MALRVSTRPSPNLLQGLLSLPPALRRTIVTSNDPELYDVVCIGGGPVGLSLLSALRSQPSTKQLKVALIDGQELKHGLSKNNDEYSNRCSSLTPSSIRFLLNIGAWMRVDQKRIQRYHAMEVWDGVSGSKISFDPLQQSGGGLLDSLAQLVPGNRFSESRRKFDTNSEQNVVATMCENSNLTTALVQELKADNWLEILDGKKVEKIELGPEPVEESGPDLSLWPTVTLSDGKKLTARLLVGADGANSPVRNFADIPSDGWDYNQHGVVATLTLDQSYSTEEIRTAYQRFLPTGPIALLPLPDNKASLVWSISTQFANKLKQLSTEDFLALVNGAFRMEPLDINYLLTNSPSTTIASDVQWRLQNIALGSRSPSVPLPNIISIQPNSVASFPLRMRHASTYTGHRIALIGDAAHTIHPLAGQGLNLGLADAESLARHIQYGMQHGMDIGTCWCLDGYNADRWAKNNAVMGVCDKLQKLYSVGSGPVVWGRSLGLDLIDRIGPAKRFLMGAAGGK